MPRAAREVPATEAEAAAALDLQGADIEVYYRRLPGEVSRWNLVVARAEEAVRRADEAERGADLALDAWVARRHLEVAEAGEKRPPEHVVHATVRADARYEAHRRAVIDARAVKSEAMRARDEAAAVLEGLRVKKDMIVSLGAHVRLEMERDALIRRRDGA
jgi:hypothetical protein